MIQISLTTTSQRNKQTEILLNTSRKGFYLIVYFRVYYMQYAEAIGTNFLSHFPLRFSDRSRHASTRQFFSLGGFKSISHSSLPSSCLRFLSLHSGRKEIALYHCTIDFIAPQFAQHTVPHIFGLSHTVSVGTSLWRFGMGWSSFWNSPVRTFHSQCPGIFRERMTHRASVSCQITQRATKVAVAATAVVAGIALTVATGGVAGPVVGNSRKIGFS